jgi:hypothetical protein
VVAVDEGKVDVHPELLPIQRRRIAGNLPDPRLVACARESPSDPGTRRYVDALAWDVIDEVAVQSRGKSIVTTTPSVTAFAARLRVVPPIESADLEHLCCSGSPDTLVNKVDHAMAA